MLKKEVMMSTNLSNLPARTRPGNTALVVVVSLVILLGLGVGGVMLYQGDGDGSTKEASTTAELASVELSDFDISTLAMGELEAKNRIEIRNRMDGMATIIEIVPEGTTVAEGDLLVKLNADAIEDEIASEELALDEAKAQLLAAETDLEIQKSENDSRTRKAKLQIDLADLALKQWREGDLVKTLNDQKLSIEQAERQVERLSDKCEKNVELLEKQFISKDQFDLDNIALIDAQASLTRANLTALVYEKYQQPRDEKQKLSDLEEAKAELERVEQENDINSTSKQAAVTNRRRQAERRQQRLDEFREQLAYSTVTAPSPGLVVYGTTVQSDNWRMSNDGPLQVGRQVGPNDLLIVLPDTSQMMAKVKVHESLAGRIRPGQPATVKVEAVGTTYQGTVDSVGVMAEGGGWRDPNLREYSVRIALDDGQETTGLKPSMRAESNILLGNVEQALNVPIQAVFIDGPVTYVYMPEGTRFVRKPIQLGRRSDTRAEILAGLDVGDLVLLRTPTPGEVVSEPWDEQELQVAGYSLDEEGNPMAPPRSRGGGPRGRSPQASG